MSRILMAALSLSLFLFAGCGDGGTESGEEVSEAALKEAWDAAMQKHGEAETDEDKLAVIRGFLEEYPETIYTADALGGLVYYMGRKLDDIDGAIDYIKELRGRLSEPRIALEVDLQLLGAYEQAGRKDSFLELADALTDAEGMKYTDHLSVVRSAVELGAWEIVSNHCGAAEEYANLESFKAEYPGEEFDEDYLATAGDNRKGLLLGYDGWAKFNLGQVEEALADFAEAEGLVRKHYLGHPDSDLYSYWGTAALEHGDYDTAIEKLSPIGIVVGEERALANLRRAYVGKNGSEAGFDEFAMAKRRELAKTVEDFTLPDYEGNSRSFADLQGEVTVLSFWFPT